MQQCRQEKTNSHPTSISVIMNLKSISVILFIIQFFTIRAIAEEAVWPKVVETETGKIVIYQPQPESLNGDQLRVRAAFSVTTDKKSDPVFGALWANARVSIDRDKRIVHLLEATITDVRFPSNTDSAKYKVCKQTVEQEVPKWKLSISLDALLTSIEQESGSSAGELSTDVPEIIYRSTPTILVLLDGSPKTSSIDNSHYKRIVNTPFFLIQDSLNGQYYLYGGGKWFMTASLDKGWKPFTKIDDEMRKMQQAVEDEQKKNQPDDQTGDSAAVVSEDITPEIEVRTAPAELITSKGALQFAPIKETQLLYATNTDNYIFQYIPEQSYYLLVSGRWYASASMQSGWKYVASDKLPKDFSLIPEGSDKDVVLASVAGTKVAKEAVMDAQVPQTAAVNRKDATCTVTYDGTPNFAAIQGTKLYYATNTSSSVIKEGETFYVCQNAVWFTGTTPGGPWTVATSVPAEVSKIPSSSPVYNVKYVYVYQSTPEVVYVGYTPGYTGCYIMGPTVVYGTGYYYPGWYGTYYYPRPVTYGFNVHYNPWTGWSCGYSVGYGRPNSWISVSVYGGHGGWWGPAYRPPYYYRPPYGGYYGPRGGPAYGRYPAGYRPAPPRSNNIYNYHQRGVNTPQKDRSIVNNAAGRVPDNVRNNAGKAGGMDNNVFTDKGGNVYRNNRSNWQQHDGRDWQPVKQSSGDNGGAGRPKIDNLNRDQINRDRGQMRTNNFNNFNNMNRGGSAGGAQRMPARGGAGMGGRR